ncbi:hypothetical protein HHI36_019157 [Cryptolaemus montrouzieri]|uniref:Uncharacterized protein n=1 Tax=Cryptolaemus montrouzieri TaxID=559131 RepID=A0ABD2P2M3_9CUCU
MGNKRFSPDGHENKGEKKRSFQGNQFTVEADVNFVSTSAEKLKNNSEFEVNHDMGVTIGQTARNYADNVDKARILRAENTAKANCKEARTLRRDLKAAENDNFEETEGLLYAPVITD